MTSFAPHRQSRVARRVLNARKVRHYLVEHPGSTAAEIVAATKVRGALMWLNGRKLARFEKGKDGQPTRWWARAMENVEET